MFNVITGIIQHIWDTDAWNNTEQQVIYYICGALIIILTVTFIDLIYRIFSHFWNGRR